jgi:hypothetical protein
MTIAFTPWPKTPRLFRDAVITEKIDGTNAAVVIRKVPFAEGFATPLDDLVSFHWSEDPNGPPAEFGYLIGAQSRSRLITPLADNFGFAQWVQKNALGLIRVLGEGVHFGEWWGSGIQRGYGLPKGERRFSLFNVHRYAHVTETDHGVSGLGVVPVLWEGGFSTAAVEDALVALTLTGSHAAPGFDRPEGVIVFHSAAGSVFKALIENDDKPKGGE